MRDFETIPNRSYGITETDIISDGLDNHVMNVRRNGFTVLHSGYTFDEVSRIKSCFQLARDEYKGMYEHTGYLETEEQFMIRCPLSLPQCGELFRQLSSNDQVIALVSRLIAGSFILNQQNGLINPPLQAFAQSKWHRDLPYQHWTSSRPLAINALYCVDDFTAANGATYVLPGSHLHSTYPSGEYVAQNAIQINARAGDYLVLDCLLFHSGGHNRTETERRGVNHVYTIPHISQQILLSSELSELEPGLCDDFKKLTMLDKPVPKTVAEYLSRRIEKLP